MKHINWQRVAGLAALSGGILQAVLLFFQMSQLNKVLRGGYHVTWNWSIPREYQWISVGPWFFLLIALLFLYRYAAQWLRWPVWKGSIYILLTIIAIVVPETALTMVNPNCVPNLPCNPGNLLIPDLLRTISIIGGMLLGGYFLLLGGYFLLRRRAWIHAPFWDFAFLVLGVLAFHTCIVAAEVGEWVPGYFKIDLVPIILGLAWATIWCFIGCVLWLKLFSLQSEIRAENVQGM